MPGDSAVVYVPRSIDYSSNDQAYWHLPRRQNTDCMPFAGDALNEDSITGYQALNLVPWYKCSRHVLRVCIRIELINVLI